MADRIGEQLGHYRLAHKLGAGAFAEVYLGEHVHLPGHKAAIKVLQAQLTDAEHLKQFRDEASRAIALVHPHLLRVLDFGIEQGTPYLVIDYAPHGSLRQRHLRGTLLAPATILPYIQQIADGLTALHAAKLIHRDLKPENLLVGQNQEILVSDFGIAVLTDTHYEHPQNVAGTVAYMAPEQLQGEPHRASDQYTLGIITYEWLTGHLPFQGSWLEIASQHALKPPPPLRVEVPAISFKLEEAVLRALAKTPAERFPSVQEFAEALTQAIHSDTQKGYTTQPGPMAQASGTPRLLARRQHPGPVQALAWSPDGQHLASSGGQPQVEIWDAATGQPRLIYQGHTAPIEAIAWSSDGNFLASVARTEGFVWEAATGTNRAAYRSRQTWLRSVAWSPDGRRLVSISGERVVQVWEAETGYPLLTYTGHAGTVSAAAWSPDGQRLASGGEQCVLLWAAITGRSLLTYSGHAGLVTALAWSPDGRFLASADTQSPDVHIWEATTGRLIWRCGGHTGGVRTLTWSPDGQRLASGGADQIVQVWAASTGQCLLRVIHHAAVLILAWSPDGQRIAAGSAGGTAQVWLAL